MTDDLLVDHYLPTYDETQFRHVVVDADRETTYRAVREADFGRTGPGVAFLGWLRMVPERLSRWLGGRPPPATPPARFGPGEAEALGWIPLDERPGEELVIGLVGKFWKPIIEIERVEPDEFAGFDRPGYAKLAVSFSLRPYGEGRTLLTYEARTATTDPESRRKFQRYWSLIGPFAGYLMGRGLARIEEDAEAMAAANRARIEVGD